MAAIIIIMLILAIPALMLGRSREIKKRIREYYRENGLEPVSIKIMSSESTGTANEKRQLQKSVGADCKIELVRLGQDYKYVVFRDKKVVEVKDFLNGLK